MQYWSNTVIEHVKIGKIVKLEVMSLLRGRIWFFEEVDKTNETKTFLI